MNRAEQRVTRAAERRLRLQRTGDEQLAAAIRAAQADGSPITRLTRLAGFNSRQAVYDLLRRAGVALAVLALAAVALPAANADARTAILSENPRYQEWIDAARVPTPDATIRVVETGCPYDEAANGCTHPGDTIWLDSDTSLLRDTLLHELGHQFDYRALDDGERARLMFLLRLDGAWRQPEAAWEDRPTEVFASAYSACARRWRARGEWRFPGWESLLLELPAPARLTRVCHAIRGAY